MKYLILFFFLFISSLLSAQVTNPTSFSVSYFGETVIHPGLKMGLTYDLKRWEKSKTKRNGVKKNTIQGFELSPTVGFYYHKDYQTGIFILPEFSYTRTKTNGNFMTYGFGAGYMRSIIPSVYELNSNGEIEKIHTGNNYFVTNYFVSFGRDLTHKQKLPMKIFLKPQFMYALPNYETGVLYFAFEFGISYKLTKKETK